MFGPFLTFVSPSAGEVLGWFFVVFNGLEGFFSIVLYMLIQSKHMDERKQVAARRKLMKLDEDMLHSLEELSIDRHCEKSKHDSRNSRSRLTEIFEI